VCVALGFLCVSQANRNCSLCTLDFSHGLSLTSLYFIFSLCFPIHASAACTIIFIRGHWFVKRSLFLLQDQKRAEKVSKRVNAIQEVKESVALLTQLLQDDDGAAGNQSNAELVQVN